MTSGSPSIETWTDASRRLEDCLRDIALAHDSIRPQVFMQAARQIAELARAGWLDSREAIDRLHEVAEAHDLIADHGEDAVQAVLAEAFEGVEIGPRPTNGHDANPLPHPCMGFGLSRGEVGLKRAVCPQVGADRR
jgi:hypothetical protein